MTTLGSPMISVIVCTYNRHESLQRALESVWLQDMKDTEVIVVDDGSDRPVELPHHYSNRVRLIRTEHRGVGAARSAGLNAAKGTFVAYCDDDDEWKPNHLRALLNYLLEHPEVDLVYGDSEWVKEGAVSSVAYSIDYDAALLTYANYVFASDVLHRASAARDVGGFDTSLQAFEDWDLWLRMSQVHVLRHVPIVLGSHHWHKGCVSAAGHAHEWQRVYRYHQQMLARTGAAQQDVIQSAASVVSFDRSTWRRERRELIWHSILLPNQSYGHVARHLLLAMERQGVDITMAPTRNQAPHGLERFYKPLDHWGRLGLYYNLPGRPSVLRCERIINHSTWDSTRVPNDLVEEINRAVVLQYVPSRQNLENFQESGVRVPIKVLHHGVDAEEFPYMNRSHSGSFTFGSFGDFSPRKGIDVLVRAFQDEFSPREPVHLLLKSTGSTPPYAINDPRIVLISGFMNREMLLEFLRKMDVFVLPSRGEGFGLAGLEAMATGLPVIATNWGGPVEYLDPQDSFPLSYRLVDAQGVEANQVRHFGLWAEPDYEHLRYLMRWLYEHPEEAAQKGRIAAERVHERWTWERVAKQMCDDLDVLAAM
jgi:glycosyltransferase involved in cell wall biosynthesis/GT2 family glycosyltransferase